MVSLRRVEEEGVEHVVEELRVRLVQWEGQPKKQCCGSETLKIKNIYADPKFFMYKKACSFLNNLSMLCRIIPQALSIPEGF